MHSLLLFYFIIILITCIITGGSEWCIEDIIPLKCIPLPNILFNIDPSLHLSDHQNQHHPPFHPPKCKRQMTLDSRDSFVVMNGGHRVAAHHQVHTAATNFHHEPKRSVRWEGGIFIVFLGSFKLCGFNFSNFSYVMGF